MIDIKTITEPIIIPGGYHVDDRGTLVFINDFEISQFKRFYIVENFSKGFIRAWHGHNKEAKAILVTSGTALIGLKNMNDEEAPKTWTLDSHLPKILLVPSGYANGFKTLTDNCQIMFFSTSTLEESKQDDIRFPWDSWGQIWGENYR